LAKVDAIAIELHDDTVFGKGTEAFFTAIEGLGFDVSHSGELTVCRKRLGHGGGGLALKPTFCCPKKVTYRPVTAPVRANGSTPRGCGTPCWQDRDAWELRRKLTSRVADIEPIAFCCERVETVRPTHNFLLQ